MGKGTEAISDGMGERKRWSLDHVEGLHLMQWWREHKPNKNKNKQAAKADIRQKEDHVIIAANIRDAAKLCKAFGNESGFGLNVQLILDCARSNELVPIA